MLDMQAQIVRGHLQTASIKHFDADLINAEVFPILDLPSSKSKITIYNRGDQYRSEAAARARGTEAVIGDQKITTADINTVQYAYKHRITDEDVRDAGLEAGMSPPVNLIQDAIERNARKIHLRREIAVKTAVFAATWIDGNATGEDAAGLWAPPGSTNTFLADIDTALSALVKAGVDIASLRLCLDYPTMQLLKRVDAIRDNLKYTSDQSLSEATLARLLGIEKVVVSRGIYSTAKELVAGTDFTGAMIWEKNAGKGGAFLYHYPKTPGLKTLAAGYQPRSKMPNGEYRMTKSYRREELSAWDYETQEETGTIITALTAGYLWNDTIVS